MSAPDLPVELPDALDVAHRRASEPFDYDEALELATAQPGDDGLVTHLRDQLRQGVRRARHADELAHQNRDLVFEQTLTRLGLGDLNDDQAEELYGWALRQESLSTTAVAERATALGWLSPQLDEDRRSL